MSDKSAFSTANQSLKQLLRYFRYELQMPSDTIRQMVIGILTSFDVEDVYERERMLARQDGPK